MLLIFFLVVTAVCYQSYCCDATKTGLVGPTITIPERNEDKGAKFTDGTESCPNYVEAYEEKYPVISEHEPKTNKNKSGGLDFNAEKINKNLKFGNDVLSFLCEEISSRNQHYDYNDFRSFITRKRSEFQNSLRKRLISWASAASSSTAIAGLATSTMITTTKVTATRIDEEGKENVETSLSTKNGKIVDEISITKRDTFKIPIQIDESYSDYNPNPHRVYSDKELVEGARLISASFGFLSSSVGLVADTVRIVGDTTAGLAGSSVKLAGQAVKSVSTGLNSAGKLIEGKNREVNINGIKKRPLTSTRLAEGSRKSKTEYSQIHGNNNRLFRNTRAVAGQSIRLIGNVFQGVGESLLLVGAATETIASSTAGIAEDTVRVVEDFAGVLSDVFAPNRHRLQFDEYATETTMNLNSKKIHDKDDLLSTSFVHYGKQDDVTFPPGHSETQFDRQEGIMLGLKQQVKMLFEETILFLNFIFSDVEGVPSIAHQLLGTLVLLYIVSIYMTNSRKGMATEAEENVNPQDGNQINHNNIQYERNSDEEIRHRRTNASICLRSLKRLYQWATRLFFRTIFSRSTILLTIYLSAFMLISRDSRLRTEEIRRNAEIAGFRAAVTSMYESSSAVKESTAWLNALFMQIWRVKYSNSNSYGGLEPYIASYFGEKLMKAMTSTPELQPNDVAYFSIDSFTLGTVSPFVRSVKIHSVDTEKNIVDLKLDVDAMLSGSNLILDIKLSALDYALLPSTKLSINSLDVQVPVFLSVTFSPSFPYVSTLNVTMETLPKYKVKITPSSDTSGLKGIDLASLPVLSSWIEKSVNLAIMPYVYPQYISIDIAGLLSTTDHYKRKKDTTLSKEEQLKMNNNAGFESLKKLKNIFQLQINSDDQIIQDNKGIPHSISFARRAATTGKYHSKATSHSSMVNNRRSFKEHSKNGVMIDECPNPIDPTSPDSANFFENNPSKSNEVREKIDPLRKVGKKLGDFLSENIPHPLVVLAPIGFAFIADKLFVEDEDSF